MMTDSELNELLATKVMKPRKVIRTGNRVRCYSGFMLEPYDFNPCHDYNHLRQVEEALSEEQRVLYVRELAIELDTGSGLTANIIVLIYATANQRCEAIAKVVGVL